MRSENVNPCNVKAKTFKLQTVEKFCGTFTANVNLYHVTKVSL